MLMYPFAMSSYLVSGSIERMGNVQSHSFLATLESFACGAGDVKVQSSKYPPAWSSSRS